MAKKSKQPKQRSPKLKEFVEGEQALNNFVELARRVLDVPKTKGNTQEKRAKLK